MATACGLCKDSGEGCVEVLVHVLQVFAYTSDRKRMSVLVRVNTLGSDNGEHMLFCKVGMQGDYHAEWVVGESLSLSVSLCVYRTNKGWTSDVCVSSTFLE